MRQSSKLNILTAYHEAGHATIATILGISLNNVSMKGETTYNKDGDPKDRILVTLAGVFSAQSFDNNGLLGMDDLNMAKKLLPAGEDFLEFQKKSKKLVLKNKKNIAKVAKALLNKEYLSGKDVKAILENPNEDMDFPGLMKITDLSYDEVMLITGSQSATQNSGKVRNWHLVEILDRDTFLKLMMWVDNKTLEAMALSTWKDRKEPEQKRINVEKIEDIQNEIKEREGYSHFNPIMFRDLYKTFREERSTFPHASYFLDDGLHRSFAIADLLVKKELDFTPIIACYSEVIE